MKNKTLGIIWQSVKDNKLTFILVIIAVIATIVVSLLPALVLEQIINNLSQQKNVSFILVAAYFGLIAFNCFWEAIREMQLSIFGQKVTYELRLKMCEKLTTLKTGYFTKTTPEENVSRFVNDVDTVENLFSSGIISMIADLGKIISVLMIIFVKNKGLTVIVLLLLPLIYLFTRFMQKRMLASQLENRTAVQKVTGFVPQTVNCIRMIHCFSAENYMCKRYDKYLDESYTATNKTNFYDAVYSPIILFVNAMIIALIFLLSATDNVEIRNLFAMSAGTSAAVISYVTVIFTPLESIGMEIQTIQSAIAGLKRIDDFLNEEQRIEGQENMIVSNKPCVSMQNVDFAYADRKVLDNFSLDIQKGENITLVGRSGSGKSTILKLILGLYSCDKGDIYLYDSYADKIADKYKRKIFGYVQQSFNFVQGTIKEQLTLFDETISDKQVEEALDLVDLKDTVAKLPLGINTPCEKEMFSQGQWQLLSIARAVVGKPQVLLLDEITANLDERTQQQVLAAMQKVSNEYTIISVSHRYTEKISGRIIDVGKTIEQ